MPVDSLYPFTRYLTLRAPFTVLTLDIYRDLEVGPTDRDYLQAMSAWNGGSSRGSRAWLLVKNE
ncbi:hypothetical protein J1614_001054 [Plenodomus biglobosus]|nr:hypothetical protein J1614_001054 [Plenodomus biglobosus]